MGQSQEGEEDDAELENAETLKEDVFGFHFEAEFLVIEIRGCCAVVFDAGLTWKRKYEELHAASL